MIVRRHEAGEIRTTEKWHQGRGEWTLPAVPRDGGPDLGCCQRYANDQVTAILRQYSPPTDGGTGGGGGGDSGGGGNGYGDDYWGCAEDTVGGESGTYCWSNDGYSCMNCNAT